MSAQLLSILGTIHQKIGGKLVIGKNSAVFSAMGKEIKIRKAKKSVSLTHDFSEESLRKYGAWFDFKDLEKAM